MTVTIGRIRGHTAIIGAKQGFLGLPIRQGITHIKLTSGREFDASCIETAWLFDADDIAKLTAGEPLISRLIGAFPDGVPPMNMWVGDDFVLPQGHPDA